MSSYSIRTARPADAPEIANVYNTNQSFLLHHLGCGFVDTSFIEDEIKEMNSIGFIPSVIVEAETGRIIGVLDYNTADPVYLSLLMLAADQQHRGVGQEIYKSFETCAAQAGKAVIRIDVVNEYAENALPFWEKQGFVRQKEILLTWGNKQSNAVAMTKSTASFPGLRHPVSTKWVA